MIKVVPTNRGLKVEQMTLLEEIQWLETSSSTSLEVDNHTIRYDIGKESYVVVSLFVDRFDEESWDVEHFDHAKSVINYISEAGWVFSILNKEASKMSDFKVSIIVFKDGTLQIVSGCEVIKEHFQKEARIFEAPEDIQLIDIAEWAARNWDDFRNLGIEEIK